MKEPYYEVGDRLIGVVEFAERHGMPVQKHVVVFVVEEDSIRDVEDAGFTLEDCISWMPENLVISFIAEA